MRKFREQIAIKKDHIIHPIPPFYDENSNILILGSFPSVKSREQMFFYGHPQNRFWKVVAAVFDSDVPVTVPEKKDFLKKHHIALWDVIGSCDIEGSSDSSIENVVANDISVIINHAKIRGVFVNGKTAEKYYKKYIEPKTGIKAVCLPSTSPANAAWSVDKLTDTWSEAMGSVIDIQDKICELFELRELGRVDAPVTPVSGGFMHRMYKVDAAGRSYAVKHLNPAIMKRPGVMDNYKRAEKLEKIIEDAGIPVVAAVTIGGRKMQKILGDYFYIFNWQEGSITDWDNITPDQCRMAGEIQGRIHSIEQRKTKDKPELSNIDWNEYIKKAKSLNSGIAETLDENLSLLVRVQKELNEARSLLPDTECITDEDMDPKNVMWHDGRPVVIDLECLDHGSPVSHALQLSLQWAGVTTCSIDTDKIRAFFEGYLAKYDNGFRDYDKVFGLAYTWIEWLEYNIERALGQCQDEEERRMAVGEVKNTLKRIRYISDMETETKKILSDINSHETWLKSLPAGIFKLIDGKPYIKDDVGMSDSGVLIFEDSVLKILKYRKENDDTVRMMKWMSEKNEIPVPKVICYEKDQDHQYLLMSRVPGKMSCDQYYMEHPREMLDLLAKGLKMLWDADISDCPRRRDPDIELQEARYRVEHDLVDLSCAEPDTFGEGGFKDPKELLEWLEKNRPGYDPVLSHGDFCLPNVFVENGKISGFIDLGDTGIGDKWRDIALCYRSLKHNFDGTFGGKVYPDFDPEMLFDALGIEPDREKLRYYILLDELF